MTACPKCAHEINATDMAGDPPTCPVCGATVDLAAGNVPAAAPPGDSLPIVPGYELIRHVGKGGMGSVWEAQQTVLGRKVAVKILAPRLSRNPHFQARFTREAQTLARLQHPGIVGIHDFITRDDLCCIVMEYVAGPNRLDPLNVYHLVRQGLLDPDRTESIVLEVLDALQYAHEEGVIHRDVKPSNLLVNRLNRVKVVDFGIAAIRDDSQGEHTQLTQAGGPLGTIEYMAPEQIENPAGVDCRADVYSMGIVVYEMLTGSRPRGVFPLPSECVPGLSTGWDELVCVALQPNPADRFQSASEMAAAIQEIGQTFVSGRAPRIEPLPGTQTVKDVHEDFPDLEKSLQALQPDTDSEDGAEHLGKMSADELNAPTVINDQDRVPAPSSVESSQASADLGPSILPEEPSAHTDTGSSVGPAVADAESDVIPLEDEDEERPEPEPEAVPAGLIVVANVDDEEPLELVLDRHPVTEPRPTIPGEKALPFRPFGRPPTLLVCLLDDGRMKQGEYFRIRKPRFVIGRETGDIVLPYDRSMSGQHVEISLAPVGDGRFDVVVRDLNSTNGTFARVTRAVVEDRQHILIGQRRYVLRQANPETASDDDMLVELTQRGSGRSFALRRSSVVIGRDPLRCSLVVLGDPFISPLHAKLKRDQHGRWTIRTLGAKNGVWIRVKELTLSSGGAFQVGNQRVLVKFP